MTAPKWTWENKITVGNVLTIAITICSLMAGYMTLVGTVGASAEAVKVLPGLETRVSTIETRINIGQQACEAFQAETRQALKEQSATLTQILQVQATILARLEDRTRP